MCTVVVNLRKYRQISYRLLDNACRSYRMLEEARRPRKVALIRKDSEIDISLSEEIFREAILALSEVPETCRSSPAAIEAMHMVLMDWAKASREEWRKLKQCFQEAQDGSTRRDRDNTSIDSLMPRIGGLRRRYEEVKVLLAEETSSRQAFRNEFQSRLEIKIARRIEEEDKTGKGTLPRATLKKVPAEAAKVSPEVIEALKRSVDLEIREIQAARSQVRGGVSFVIFQVVHSCPQLRPFLDSPEVQMPGADGHSEPVSSQFSQEGRKREDEVEAFQFAVRLIVARQFSGHCDELAKKILAKNLEQNEILLAKVWERLLPVLVTLRYVYGQLYR